MLSLEEKAHKYETSARCLRFAQLAQVSYESYLKVMSLHREYLRKREIYGFRRYLLFKDLDFEQIEKIKAQMTLVSLAKNNVIYKEGDEAKYIYFIKSG